MAKSLTVDLERFTVQIVELYEPKEAQKRFRQGKTAKRKLGSVDKCELCGNEYIVMAGRQKYCSEKCQHEAGLLLQKEYKSAYNKETEQTKKKLEKNSKKQKICEYCGKKFQSKVASNTCSDYLPTQTSADQKRKGAD